MIAARSSSNRRPPTFGDVPVSVCRWWTPGAVMLVAGLLGTISCRIREDAPPAPSAAASEAPAPSSSVALKPTDAGNEAGRATPDAEPPPEGSEALGFAGLGTGPAAEPALREAIRAALTELGSEGSPARAAVAAVVVLEDDPALNAGTGASLRADGTTVECDAAVMELTPQGSSRFAGVAAVSGIKNPIRVAERLLGAPSPVLSGQGAKDFAARVGIAFPPVPQPGQVDSYRAALIQDLQDAGSVWRRAPWSGYVERRHLGDAGLLALADAGAGDGGGSAVGDAAAALDAAAPDASLRLATLPSGSAQAPEKPPTKPAPRAPSKPAPAPPPAAPRPPPPSPSAAPGAQPAGSATAVPLPAPRPRPTPADTVALLIRDANDLFAVAASSGGPLLALPGRVGDVAVPGAGIYVGKQGAVAITGRGELLVELQLARKVYERLELTRSARISAVWGLKQLPKDEQVGIAVLGKRDAHVAQSGDVAWMGWRDGKWRGPEESK